MQQKIEPLGFQSIRKYKLKLPYEYNVFNNLKINKTRNINLYF